MIKNVSHLDFNKNVLENKKPVLVEFHASWCGPCKAMEKELNRISSDFTDQLCLFRISVDEEPGLAQEYRIKAYPTLLIMNNGRILEQVIGFTAYEEIKESLANSGIINQ
ncbi:MAG: thioredoxin family protein [Vulcanimicrobiota bacterium]